MDRDRLRVVGVSEGEPIGDVVVFDEGDVDAPSDVVMDGKTSASMAGEALLVCEVMTYTRPQHKIQA